MFDNVAARYALRCALFGVAALIASLQAGNGAAEAVLAGAAAALAYAGIGAASKSVEPNIGRKRDNA